MSLSYRCGVCGVCGISFILPPQRKEKELSYWNGLKEYPQLPAITANAIANGEVHYFFPLWNWIVTSAKKSRRKGSILNSAIFNNQQRTNNSQFQKCASIRVWLVNRLWLRVITMLIYILNFIIAILHSYCFAWLLIAAEFRFYCSI